MSAMVSQESGSGSFYRPTYSNKKQRRSTFKPSSKAIVSYSNIRKVQRTSVPRLMKQYQNALSPVMQCCRIRIPVNTSSGWNSVGPSLTMAFNLNGTAYSVAGSAYNTQAFDNSPVIVSVFDEWRLEKVQVETSYGFNGYEANNNRNILSLYAAKDHNDGNITDILEIMAYNSVKKQTLNGFNTYKMVVDRPTVQGSLETTSFLSTTTAGMIRVSPWISCDSPTVAHYGLKYVVDTNAFTPFIGEVTFFVRAFFTFKNTR